jgi:uncharacterized membrane protein YfcA
MKTDNASRRQLITFVFLAAASIAGFAFSAPCGAFLFHDGSTPRHVVELIVVSSIAIQAFGVVALWQSIRWRDLPAYLGGAAFGLPIGLFLLDHVSTPTYGRTMGAFLVAYGTYLLCRPPVVVRLGTRAGHIVDTIVGFLGGITGGAAGFPSACVAI